MAVPAPDITMLRAYVDGAVYCTNFGVTNATAPIDASSSVDAAFKAIGGVSDDGIAETTSQDRTAVYLWQKNQLARQIPGQYSKVFKFAATETNLITAGVHWGGSTITQTAEGLSIAENPPVGDIRQWVLHGIDGAKAHRVYVPLGEVTGRGDSIWSSKGLTIYEWTLTAYLDPLGHPSYRYVLDDALAL
jgi:hypothetical protein